MLKKLKKIFEEIYSMDFGYPVEGFFGDGASKEIIDNLEKQHLPEDYISFHRNCGHINALDIHNGYCIDRGESLIQQFQENQKLNMPIIGSDGGGNLFKLRMPDGKIFKTDPAGANAQFITNSFGGFLSILYDDWTHFKNEDQNWSFISG